MRRLFTMLRPALAAALCLAGSAALADDTPTPFDQALATLQSAYARAVRPGDKADQHLDLLGSVLRRVRRSHAAEVDFAAFAAAGAKAIEPLEPGAGEPVEVFRKAVNTALRTLDPWSRYLDAQAHRNDRIESSSSFGGLGLELQADDGAVRVVTPTPGGPAARAGLQAGDTILRVDDAPLQGVALADAIARMRGEPGSEVSLTLRRAGLEREFTVALVRDTIRRPSLRWNMEGDVLVLRLGGFRSKVTAEVEEAIAKAQAEHAPAAAVLDLRGNPGGLLREAVAIADLFLDKGAIVSVRGRTPASQRSWEADPQQLLAGLPMVVLIDRRSASAAELLADALQDNGRAKVMGQRSYGKGSVQVTYPLGEDLGALRLTTSYYHGPSGRTVNKGGVAPDIELFPAPPARAATAPTGGAAASAEAARPEPPAPAARVDQARCTALHQAADAALSCAVAYLRAGSIEEFVAAVR